MRVADRAVDPGQGFTRLRAQDNSDAEAAVADLHPAEGPSELRQV